MTRDRAGLVAQTLAAVVTALAPAAVFGVDQTVQVGPGMVFSPANVTVSPGDTVTWNFNELHSSTSDSQIGPETWDSGQLFTGTFSHTFNTPGNYPYYCTVHSFPGGTLMNGVVQVSGVGVTPTPTLTVPPPTSTPTSTPQVVSTPTPTPTSLVAATPTQTPPAGATATPTQTPAVLVTATPTPPAPGPSATPISGVGPAGIPDLDFGGRALLLLALAAAGVAVLLFTHRR